MISHATSDRFALLLRDTRERYGIRQEDVSTPLGIDRSLVAKWERGEYKRPVSAGDVNQLAKVFPDVPVIQWVIALGYDVRFEGIEDEEEVALLEAYRQLQPRERQMLRAAAGLPGNWQQSQELPSLRRLSATGRQDRQETQE